MGGTESWRPLCRCTRLTPWHGGDATHAVDKAGSTRFHLLPHFQADRISRGQNGTGVGGITLPPPTANSCRERAQHARPWPSLACSPSRRDKKKKERGAKSPGFGTRAGKQGVELCLKGFGPPTATPSMHAVPPVEAEGPLYAPLEKIGSRVFPPARSTRTLVRVYGDERGGRGFPKKRAAPTKEREQRRQTFCVSASRMSRALACPLSPTPARAPPYLIRQGEPAFVGGSRHSRRNSIFLWSLAVDEELVQRPRYSLRLVVGFT
ncbi:hypothetical protein MRX96_030729 [Rhipicephalus microplus]